MPSPFLLYEAGLTFVYVGSSSTSATMAAENPTRNIPSSSRLAKAHTHPTSLTLRSMHDIHSMCSRDGVSSSFSFSHCLLHDADSILRVISVFHTSNWPTDSPMCFRLSRKLTQHLPYSLVISKLSKHFGRQIEVRLFSFDNTLKPPLRFIRSNVLICLRCCYVICRWMTMRRRRRLLRRSARLWPTRVARISLDPSELKHISRSIDSQDFRD